MTGTTADLLSLANVIGTVRVALARIEPTSEFWTMFRNTELALLDEFDQLAAAADTSPEVIDGIWNHVGAIVDACKQRTVGVN